LTLVIRRQWVGELPFDLDLATTHVEDLSDGQIDQALRFVI
jgi:hypothetical protein